MENACVYKQGQVFLNNGPHSIIMFPISRDTENTCDVIACPVKQGLGLNHTSRHMEKILRINVSACKICSNVMFVNLLLGVTGARRVGAGGVGGGGGVKYRMLHMPGTVSLRYHLHVSMSVLKVLA